MLTTLRGFCRAVTSAMIVLMITMTIVVNSLVVTRYVFSYSPSWTEEITRYSMVWLVMLGAGVLTLFDDHIALTMVVDRLSKRARLFQKLFVQLFVLLMGVLLIWEGFEFAFGLDGVLAPALQVSMLWPAIAVPIGAIFIALFALLQVIDLLARIFGGEGLTMPDQFDYMDNSFKTAEDNDAHVSHPGDHGDHRGAY
ncbi:MAG: TRAP transporter small permease [Burkholderiaceae bacterium]|nr:TRAP transporter small permease [Burkholderiaceae bacterium]